MRLIYFLFAVSLLPQLVFSYMIYYQASFNNGNECILPYSNRIVLSRSICEIKKSLTNIGGDLECLNNDNVMNDITKSFNILASSWKAVDLLTLDMSYLNDSSIYSNYESIENRIEDLNNKICGHVLKIWDEALWLEEKSFVSLSDRLQTIIVSGLLPGSLRNESVSLFDIIKKKKQRKIEYYDQTDFSEDCLTFWRMLSLQDIDGDSLPDLVVLPDPDYTSSLGNHSSIEENIGDHVNRVSSLLKEMNKRIGSLDQHTEVLSKEYSLLWQGIAPEYCNVSMPLTTIDEYLNSLKIHRREVKVDFENNFSHSIQGRTLYSSDLDSNLETEKIEPIKNTGLKNPTKPLLLSHKQYENSNDCFPGYYGNKCSICPIGSYCPGDGFRYPCSNAPGAPITEYINDGVSLPQCPYRCLDRREYAANNSCLIAPIGKYPEDGRKVLKACKIPELGDVPEFMMEFISGGVQGSPFSCRFRSKYLHATDSFSWRGLGGSFTFHSRMRIEPKVLENLLLKDFRNIRVPCDKNTTSSSFTPQEGIWEKERIMLGVYEIENIYAIHLNVYWLSDVTAVNEQGTEFHPLLTFREMMDVFLGNDYHNLTQVEMKSYEIRGYLSIDQYYDFESYGIKQNNNNDKNIQGQFDKQNPIKQYRSEEFILFRNYSREIFERVKENSPFVLELDRIGEEFRVHDFIITGNILSNIISFHINYTQIGIAIFSEPFPRAASPSSSFSKARTVVGGIRNPSQRSYHLPADLMQVSVYDAAFSPISILGDLKEYNEIKKKASSNWFSIPEQLHCPSRNGISTYPSYWSQGRECGCPWGTWWNSFSSSSNSSFCKLCGSFSIGSEPPRNRPEHCQCDPRTSVYSSLARSCVEANPPLIAPKLKTKEEWIYENQEYQSNGKRDFDGYYYYYYYHRRSDSHDSNNLFETFFDYQFSVIHSDFNQSLITWNIKDTLEEAKQSDQKDVPVEFRIQFCSSYQISSSLLSDCVFPSNDNNFAINNRCAQTLRTIRNENSLCFESNTRRKSITMSLDPISTDIENITHYFREFDSNSSKSVLEQLFTPSLSEISIQVSQDGRFPGIYPQFESNSLKILSHKNNFNEKTILKRKNYFPLNNKNKNQNIHNNNRNNNNKNDNNNEKVKGWLLLSLPSLPSPSCGLSLKSNENYLPSEINDSQQFMISEPTRIFMEAQYFSEPIYYEKIQNDSNESLLDLKTMIEHVIKTMNISLSLNHNQLKSLLNPRIMYEIRKIDSQVQSVKNEPNSKQWKQYDPKSPLIVFPGDQISAYSCYPILDSNFNEDSYGSEDSIISLKSIMERILPSSLSTCHFKKTPSDEQNQDGSTFVNSTSSGQNNQVTKGMNFCPDFYYVFDTSAGVERSSRISVFEKDSNETQNSSENFLTDILCRMDGFCVNQFVSNYGSSDAGTFCGAIEYSILVVFGLGIMSPFIAVLIWIIVRFRKRHLQKKKKRRLQYSKAPTRKRNHDRSKNYRRRKRSNLKQKSRKRSKQNV